MSSEPDFIPLCVPELAGNEWTYIKECLDTNWVSSVGRFVSRFEEEFAGRLGAPHAVATVNGTAALHVALQVAGVEPGDEVLVSTLSFIAPANAIRYLGAHPVFVDVEPKHWQMDVPRVVEFVTRDCRFEAGRLTNRATGRRVRALLPVHILGHPVDLDPLLEIAREYGLVVVEDATESLGARYRGRPAGTLGALGCFSFNGNKLLTTGGGGMVVTADPELASRARYLTTQAKDNPLEFVHGAVGYNSRLTNLAAAMGVAQLERLDDLLAAKRRIRDRYARMCAELPGLTLQPEADWAAGAAWLSTVLVDPDRFGCDSRALMRRLASERIETRPLWQPLHLSPAQRGAQALGGGTAESLNARALSLPSSCGLSPAEQERVVAAIAAKAAVPA
jgi:perosamine synthetase